MLRQFKSNLSLAVRSMRAAVVEPRRFWKSTTLRLQLSKIRRQANGPLILFERPSGIGDIICTFPAVIALRDKFPGCAIVYATNQEFASVVRMGECADLVIGVDYQRRIPTLFDATFDFVLRPALEDEQPTGNEPVHLVDNFCRVLDVVPQCPQPRLQVSPTARTAMQRRLEAVRSGSSPLVAIHTGPSWPVREWSAAQWNELIATLKRSMQADVIQIGADVNTGTGPAVAQRVVGANDWVGKFNLEESVAAIACCDLLIGIDSGLLHIAGAVGTPCVGLFGAINPALRLPPETPSVGVTGNVPCLFCHHRLPRLHWRTGCPNDIACMKTLTPADALAACRAMLDRTAGTKPLVEGSTT